MTNCFGLDDVQKLWPGLKVMSAVRPPHDDEEDRDTYVHYPVNIVSPQQMNPIVDSSTDWTGEKWYKIWISRSNANPSYNQKANYIAPAIFNSSGDRCRPEFTSIIKAIASVKVQIMYLAGKASSEYEAVAVAAGFSTSDIVTISYASANADTFFPHDPTDPEAEIPDQTWKVCRDKIIVQDYKFSDVTGLTGIMTDWEPQDGRTDEQALELLSFLTDICNELGLKLAHWGNTLTRTGAENSGINSDTLAEFYYQSDYFYVRFDFADESGSNWEDGFYAQVDKLREALAPSTIDWSKMMVIYPLGDTDLRQARIVRHVVETFKPQYLYIWKRGADSGGACNLDYNRRLGCVTLGREMPRPAAISTI